MIKVFSQQANNKVDSRYLRRSNENIFTAQTPGPRSGQSLPFSVHLTRGYFTSGLIKVDTDGSARETLYIFVCANIFSCPLCIALAFEAELHTVIRAIKIEVKYGWKNI